MTAVADTDGGEDTDRGSSTDAGSEAGGRVEVGAAGDGGPAAARVAGGTSDGAGDGDGDGDEGTLPRAWALAVAAGRFLVPSTLIASLFFYFGLRYTQDHYQQYGLDDSALGFSTTDYVVRSLNVIVEPVPAIALAAAGAAVLHVALAGGLDLADRARPGSGARAARAGGGLLVIAGAVSMAATWTPGRLGLDPVDRAVAWLLGLLALLYGLYLGVVRGRLGGGGAFGRIVSGTVGEGERRLVGALLLSMAVVLVAHGAFELTRAYARERALRQALENEAQPSSFALVRIYSKVDLALDDELDVPETVLPGDDGAYRYRYDRIRLFLEQNDRLVLWPADRSPRSGMFVLRESDDLRVEYQPEHR
jgi:hypothetical protein